MRRVALLISFLLFLLGASLFILHGRDPFADIANCVQKKKNSIICTQPYIQKMLDTMSGDSIMTELNKRFDPMRCHFVGHVVGQQLYRKYQSVEKAMKECSRTCSAACPHGIIGEAFAEQLGFTKPDQVEELGHLDADELMQVGRRLCRGPQACHGVGHALFQAYQQFTPALAMCKKVTPPSQRAYCYSGVFMENADLLTDRNMRALPSNAFPQAQELPTYCTKYTDVYQKRMCFVYFPRIVYALLRAQGKSTADAMGYAKNICDSYEKHSTERSACFAGLGSNNFYLAAENPDTASFSCTFPNKADSAACNLGQLLIDAADRTSITFPYCRSITEPDLRSTCFQGLFFTVYTGAASIDEAKTNCEDDRICLDAAAHYKEDPWTLIEKTFGQSS